jgi:hypothetical protein
VNAALAVAAIVATASAQTGRVGIVHEYVPSASVAPGYAVIPSNLDVSSVYRGLVEKMLSRSPTFRRQILRIAGAQHLTVAVRTAAPWPRGIRATTRFVRDRSGHLSASIGIAPLNNDAELIAHEIEHVIEQLDEIDLKAKAARPNSGVHAAPDADDLFETTRAVRMGRQVALEVR